MGPPFVCRKGTARNSLLRLTAVDTLSAWLLLNRTASDAGRADCRESRRPVVRRGHRPSRRNHEAPGKRQCHDARLPRCRVRALSRRNQAVRAAASMGGPARHRVAPCRTDARSSGTLARTAYGDSTFLISSPEFFDRLGMRRMPSALFLDHLGVVRGRVIGAVPEEREILYTVDQNINWGASGSWQFDTATSVR